MGTSSTQAPDRDLRVATGLRDDRRDILRPGTELYARAEHVLRAQDEFTAEAHTAAWAVLLPLWPRAARQSTLDGLSVAAAMLVRDGVSLSDANWELCQAFDVVRPREPRTGRPRPSLQRGELLLRAAEAEPFASYLRRAIGTAWEADQALPRVYRAGEREPEGLWNPALRLDELGLAVAPSDHYVKTAASLLKARWYARRVEAR
jgi:hypothetical protein